MTVNPLDELALGQFSSDHPTGGVTNLTHRNRGIATRVKLASEPLQHLEHLSRLTHKSSIHAADARTDTGRSS
jgi:hypothetical protein